MNSWVSFVRKVTSSASGTIIIKYNTPILISHFLLSFPLLPPDSQHSPITMLILRLGIITIRRVPNLLLQTYKPFPLDIRPHLLPAQLHRYLLQHILKMIQQGAVVYPDSPGVEEGMDCVNVQEDVVGGVQEEAGY